MLINREKPILPPGFEPQTEILAAVELAARWGGLQKDRIRGVWFDRFNNSWEVQTWEDERFSIQRPRLLGWVHRARG